jgi:pimeloyl-ACP methyl ester carboxylesterase
MTDIARFGSFYVGGRDLVLRGRPVSTISFTDTASKEYDPNGLYHIEQAYVQYFEPVRKRSPLPVVFLHGGGMTGTMWEQTPDGRPGWAQRFVHAGFTVNVVDNVERGRAGWTPFDDVWAGPPILRNTEEAWSLFRIGDEGRFDERRPFEGQRFPVEHLDVLETQQVPRWLSNNPLAIQAFSAVLDRIGPCTVIAHSHGGYIALKAAAMCPHLVKNMVLVESSGFLAQDELPVLRDTAFLFLYGDNLDATPLWQSLMKQAAAFRQGLEKAGARVRWDEMPQRGVYGNSHMLMMDNNSDAIADGVCEWLLT